MAKLTKKAKSLQGKVDSNKLYPIDNALSIVKACATAKDAWELLAAEFASQSYARKVQLKRDMVHLSYNSGESLQQYVARAKTLAGALNAAGCKVPAEDLVGPPVAALPRDPKKNAAVVMMPRRQQPSIDTTPRTRTTPKLTSSRRPVRRKKNEGDA